MGRGKGAFWYINKGARQSLHILSANVPLEITMERLLLERSPDTAQGQDVGKSGLLVH